MLLFRYRMFHKQLAGKTRLSQFSGGRNKREIALPCSLRDANEEKRQSWREGDKWMFPPFLSLLKVANLTQV